MALTVTTDTLAAPAGLRFTTGTVTGDSSYPTGGEALAPSDVGLDSHISHIVFDISSTGHIAGWDGELVLIYESGGTNNPLAEIGNGDNASTYVFPYIAFGY